MCQVLSHEQLDVYHVYLDAVRLCTPITSASAHPFAALDNLQRAIETVGANLIRANTQHRESRQRVDCLDVSIAATHTCAASLDVCLAKRTVEPDLHRDILVKLWRMRGMLLGLKHGSADQVREEAPAYGVSLFPFARLDTYRLALEGVRWSHSLMLELETGLRTVHRLDTCTTGTVLTIAEGHGHGTVGDRNRFLTMALDHACEALLCLDLLVVHGKAGASRIAEGKDLCNKLIATLRACCERNVLRGC